MSTHPLQGEIRLFGESGTALRPEALSGKLALRSILVVLVGAFAYGFVFGVWRAPVQGLYAAIKLPAVFFTVIIASALINSVFASLLGANLSLRQVAMAMLMAMASSAAILGSLSPIILFALYHVEAPEASAAAKAMQTFWVLLLCHVSVIGASGLIGYYRLRNMLVGAIGNRHLARRVMFAWIAVSGFVGCEISWLYSPFLCKPNYEPHFIAREYQQGNFYQQIWRGLQSIAE